MKNAIKGLLLLVVCVCFVCAFSVNVSAKEEVFYCGILSPEKGSDWYDYYLKESQESEYGLITNIKIKKKAIIITGRLATKDYDTYNTPISYTNMNKKKLKINKNTNIVDYSGNTLDYLKQYSKGKVDGKNLIFSVKGNTITNILVADIFAYKFD